MVQDPQLSENAMKVLRLLRNSAMDGYTVMAKTKLTKEDLSQVIRELTSSSLIGIKGDLESPAVGEAYLWVPPDTQKYVDFLFRGPNSWTR